MSEATRFQARPVRWREHAALLSIKYFSFYQGHFKPLGFDPNEDPWRLPDRWWIRWELWRKYLRARGPRPGSQNFIFTIADDPTGQWMGFGDIYAAPPVGHLGNVGVLPAARGKGAGTFITDYRIAYMDALGCTEIFAHVDPDNPFSSRIREGLGLIAQPMCQVVYRIEPKRANDAPPAEILSFKTKRLRNALAILDGRSRFAYQWNGQTGEGTMSHTVGIPILEIGLPPDLPTQAWPEIFAALRSARRLGLETRAVIVWRGERLGDQPLPAPEVATAIEKSEAWVWRKGEGRPPSKAAIEAVTKKV